MRRTVLMLTAMAVAIFFNCSVALAAQITGNAGNNRITGTNNNDEIYGLNGDDEMFAYRGADQIYGGQGDDEANGGPGGDEIVLKDRDGDKYTYRVTETFKANPGDSWVMGQVVGRDMVTLQTCTGPNWERRLIVRADRL